MSRTQKENIFAQSTFHSEIWNEVNDVMDMFEEGELKGQNKGSIPKQHHLQPICRYKVGLLLIIVIIVPMIIVLMILHL